MPHSKLLLALLLSWLTTLSFADEGDFLPVNEAFKVSAVEEGNHVHFTFNIADGYYLYKHRFGFTPTEGSPGVLGEPVYQQAGKWKEDPIFGQVEVFYSSVDIYVPVEEAEDGFIEIDARYQGCADKGLCYIPQTYTNMYQVDVNAPKPDINPETPTRAPLLIKVQIWPLMMGQMLLQKGRPPLRKSLNRLSQGKQVQIWTPMMRSVWKTFSPKAVFSPSSACSF